MGLQGGLKVLHLRKALSGLQGGLKGASRRLEAFSAERGLEEGLKGASSSDGLKGA